MPKAQTKEAKDTAKTKKEKAKLTKAQFFEHLDGLTILELADYIKEFEERYGVSAAAAVKDDVSCRQVSLSRVQKALEEQGVRIE